MSKVLCRPYLCYHFRFFFFNLIFVSPLTFTTKIVWVGLQ